jgi:hypothetical protein
MTFGSLDRRVIGLVVTSVVVLIWIIVVQGASSSCSELMHGFWVAPKEFLDEAGLDSLVMFIGPKGSYILSTRDDGVLMNDQITLHTSCKWGCGGNWSSGIGMRKYSVRFEGIKYDFFPSEQEMTLYPKCGKMILSKKGTAYAVLYRDAELTDLGNQRDK